MRRLISILGVFILLAVSLFTGCQAPAAVAPTTPAPTPAAVAPTTPAPTPAEEENAPLYGGVLKVIGGYFPDNIGDPRVPCWSPACVQPALEGLLRPDIQGKPTPWLATSFGWGKDLKSITFTLRQGVKYHDGTAFNAQSVKEILDISRTSPSNPQLASITSIDILDEYTVRLNVKEYSDALLNAFWEPAGWMVSPTALKTQSEDWLASHPVGTGPFKLASYDRNVTIQYEKNPDYWIKGRPYLDGMEWIFISDLTAGLLAFKGGTAQIDEWVTPDQAAELNKEPGKWIIQSYGAGIDGLLFSSANPDSPFHDVRVRQACCYAMTY